MALSIYTVAGGWFFQYIRQPETEVGSFNIHGSRRVGFFQYIPEPEVGSFNIYGSGRLVISIYTAGNRRLVLSIYTRTLKLVLSIYTAAGSWVFQYMRQPEVGYFNIYRSNIVR